MGGAHDGTYLSKIGYTSPSTSRLMENIWVAPTAQSFFQVFIVIFPAVTGIMAGTNYSGDLADPGKSIGKGTLFAIAVSMVIYIALAILMASCLERSVTEDQEKARTIMQQVAFHPSIVVAGLAASTISSALGALVGSARVLQALARDKLVPGLGVFALAPPREMSRGLR